MFAAEWNELTEKLYGAFDEWMSNFEHEYSEVTYAVSDVLEYDFKSTLDAMNWEDEDLTAGDVISDIILSLDSVEVEDAPEMIYTQDIWNVFDEHTQECESALDDFGGVRECDSVTDAISIAVHAYLAEEANILMSDVKDSLDELETMLSE